MHEFAFSDKNFHRSNGDKACAISGIQYNQTLNGQALLTIGITFRDRATTMTTQKNAKFFSFRPNFERRFTFCECVDLISEYVQRWKI